MIAKISIDAKEVIEHYRKVIESKGFKITRIFAVDNCDYFEGIEAEIEIEEANHG